MFVPRLIRFTIVVSCALTLCAKAFAGGSISWEEARTHIVKGDPLLIAWVEEHFEIRHSGGAMRVGHDASGKSMVEGVGVGTRLPPYEFPAKPKGAKGDYTFYLIFDYCDRYNDTKELWQVTVRHI